MNDYFSFCCPESDYYEPSVGLESAIGDDLLDRAGRSSWNVTTGPLWTTVATPADDLPTQGWKVHVSATPGNAVRTLDTVADYCLERGITFKFMRSLERLVATSSKSADRSVSGKFVTIYPRSVSEFTQVLENLDEQLGQADGPYVLTDVRFRSGPLYTRYGGFQTTLMNDGGGRDVCALVTPEGDLVADSRKPVFRLPDWVSVPPVLVESIEQRNSGKVRLPYRPVQALHFSNGGGVYRALDRRSGAEVLLKEARPLAGLDARGDDAVTRLRREFDALTKLADCAGTPEVFELLEGEEHVYLAMELLSVPNLTHAVGSLHPDSSADTALAISDYRRWLIDVFTESRALLEQIFAAGLTYGDLHPGNIFVSDDLEVSFIDFESAAPIAAKTAQAMAAPGFGAPPGVVGTAADEFALAALVVYLAGYDPLLLVRDPSTARAVVDAASDQFDLPDDIVKFVEDQVETDHLARCESISAPASRSHLRREVAETASPDRASRMFGGDPRQFDSSTAAAGYGPGAGGILTVLNRVAPDAIQPEWIDWWRCAAGSAAPSNVGLGVGAAGLGLVAHELGLNDMAADLLEQADVVAPQTGDTSVIEGLAGLALVELEIGRDRDDAQLIERVERRARRLRDVPDVGLMPPGIGYGASGAALVHLRVPHPDVDLAERLISVDLDSWTASQGRGVQHRLGLLHLGGLLLAVDECLGHLPESSLADQVEPLLRELSGVVSGPSGLFEGRTGAMLAIDRVRPGCRSEVIERHRSRLDLHWVTAQRSASAYRSFLGEMGLRLSTDLATGSAGIAYGLSILDRSTEGDIPIFDLGRT